MCEDDTDIRELFDSGAMRAAPDGVRMEAARERMVRLASDSSGGRSGIRLVLVAGLVLVGLSAIGVAATHAGRELVRWIFTPVHTMHTFRYEAPIEKQPTNSSTNQGADATVDMTINTLSSHPLGPDEAAALKRKHAEMRRIKAAGGGRLTGLIEGPYPDGSSRQFTTLNVEYDLPDGETSSIGEGIENLTVDQKANMRAEEILALRDAGAGEIVSQTRSGTGLGKFTIRFTLADGANVELWAYYPPGSREDREKIFAETRLLKQQLRFKVDRANTDEVGVWGHLTYTLADGRTVGIVEDIPPQAVTPDGKSVAVPESEAGGMKKKDER